MVILYFCLFTIMEQPEKRIVEFLKKHHVLTLATSNDNRPWCAHCFYSYLEEDQTLIFTSSDDTRHIKEIMKNKYVAASIPLETNIIGKIQGIQLEGIIKQPDKKEESKYKNHYLKRFPFAILTNSPIWVLHIQYIKFTDNRLGFGKKLIWEKNINTPEI